MLFISLSFFLCHVICSSIASLESDSSFSENALYLKVLNLNTWGLNWPWSQDRDERFQALRDELVHGNYDIVMLQEVWFKRDYDILRTSMPFVTYFKTLNGNCFGSFLPLGCSGLTILSKHPMEDAQLYPFQYKGTFWNFDGEIFVKKGVAKARILYKGLKIDVFTTHMISYTHHPDTDNAKFRYYQALETVRHILKSDADVKLFGGDLNALPFREPRQPYGILSHALTDSLTDKFPSASFLPWFATFGNERNTYTSNDLPERIDYLMYSHSPRVKMKTYEYLTPLFMTKNADGKIVSLSDHEPIVGIFIIEPRKAENTTAPSFTYPPSSSSVGSPYIYKTPETNYVDQEDLNSNIVRRRHFLSIS